MIWTLSSSSCRVIQPQGNDGQVDSVFFSTLITAKIAYEKSKYYNDSNKRSLKSDYFSKVKRCKRRKSIYEPYIINKLTKKTENKTILFNYISPLSSALPLCAILNNDRLLEVLLYNLNEVKSDTTLVCDL